LIKSCKQKGLQGDKKEFGGPLFQYMSPAKAELAPGRTDWAVATVTVWTGDKSKTMTLTTAEKRA